MGWDSGAILRVFRLKDFNPPTPCGVGLSWAQAKISLLVFQSTHPLWGGTCNNVVRIFILRFQSTHPLWGGTALLFLCNTAIGISIHPPLVGWDGLACFCGNRVPISIHPPLVGWDALKSEIRKLQYNFNPPTPCGVGHGGELQFDNFKVFQSTHPLWGGTGTRIYEIWQDIFQSTHPLWGGTTVICGIELFAEFQSTHPLWGGTRKIAKQAGTILNFNPPTPCGVGHSI